MFMLATLMSTKQSRFCLWIQVVIFNAKSHWKTSGFMAPAAGLEPATIRLTVERSAN